MENYFENMKSSGKSYAGECAVISLTSWKARIKTVSKTIFSLLKQCPNFHIVLVLSEEEFPKMEKELPENLMVLVEENLLEILWIYPNIKSFKKIIPTMCKYKNIPIISADDDCIYTCNYAKELYNAWIKNKNKPIAYRKSGYEYCLCGPASLYPTFLFNDFIASINKLSKTMINENRDDGVFMNILKYKKIKPIYLKNKFPCYFHDEIQPINGKANKIYGKLDGINYNYA